MTCRRVRTLCFINNPVILTPVVGIPYVLLNVTQICIHMNSVLMPFIMVNVSGIPNVFCGFGASVGDLQELQRHL